LWQVKSESGHTYQYSVHFPSAACTCELEGRVKYPGNIEHIILYVELHICLSVSNSKIYVFHVSELMFRGNLFLMLSVLQFEITIGTVI